jgi:hypothetical protein
MHPPPDSIERALRAQLRSRNGQLRETATGLGAVTTASV